MSTAGHVTKDIVQVYERIVKRVLWGPGKRAKIRLPVLYLPKRFGGLGLTDISVRDHAIKCYWVPRILTSEEWGDAVASLFGYQGRIVFFCNLHPRHVQQLYPHLNSRWTAILESWCKLTYEEDRPSDWKESRVWLHSQILVAGSPVYWHEACVRGLVQLKHMYCGDQLLTPEELVYRYNMPMMQANQLLSAVGSYMRLPKVKRKSTKTKILNDMLAINGPKPSKNAYVELCKRQITTLKSRCQYWNEKLHMSLTLSAFVKKVSKSLHLLSHPRAISVQFRHCNNAIFAKDRLYRWGLVTTSECPACSCSHTVRHMLFECNAVKPLIKWMAMAYVARTEINYYELVFADTESKELNRVLLLYKWYVYRSFCSEQNINVHKFKSWIHQFINNHVYIREKRKMWKFSLKLPLIT